jgi:hypothetical protein
LAGPVELFESLDEAAGAAGGALERENQPEIFSRLSWFRLLQAHCPPPGRLLVARSGGTWLFLALQGRKGRAFGNWYSLRAGLIGEPLGAELIARHLRKRLCYVDIYPASDPSGLADGLKAARWIVRVSPATASWRIETDGMNFAAYWAARPSKLRNSAERKAKAAGLEVALYRHFDAGAWAEYESVYTASWKPEEGSPAFLRALAEQEGAAGTLRLGIARKDGRAVAAQLWLVENGTATIHKLAYREDAKALSPGTVLSMAMFRAALDEDRVALIDYGTGDEPYKADWMDRRHVLWRVEAWDPRSVAGLLGAARAGASHLVRRWRSG